MLDVDKLAEKALALEEKGSKGDATSEGDEAEPADDKAVAANEVFDAVKAGDREAFGVSLGAYVKLCLAEIDADDDY